MKKIIFIALLCSITFSAYTQTLTVKNHLKCTMHYILQGEDGSCSNCYISNPIYLAGSTTVTYNLSSISWLGSCTPGTPSYWFNFTLFDDNAGSSCWNGGTFVATPNCTGAGPQTNNWTLSCTCGSYYVTVDWNEDASRNVVVDIH